MSRHSTSACLLGFATLCASPLLLAACTTSSGTGNFGSLSSFAVASTAQTITGTTGFKCTGSLLSFFSTNTIDVTMTSSANPQGTTPRLRNAITGTYLPYNICRDSNCNTTYNLGSRAQWTSRNFVGILGFFNSSNGALPLYFRLPTGTTLPAGTYTDTITLNWAWHLCSAGALGICFYDDGSAISTVNLTLMVLNDCFIDSAPDVSFGNAALVSAFTTVNQNIGVRCTLNATYTIGFDNGNNFSGGWRRMLNGANAIQYNLYKPGDSTIWSLDNPQRRRGTGSAQTIPYRAIVNPAQRNVPAGIYRDTVRIILTY
ncbi:Csu type fimbrial protein [Pseudomonas aeruginosa]|uniref:Csu type fimbrial protein n=2 Tax=Pseudomonas aeruginosa TaxID=287 RepID=UPI001A25CD3C|nr:spore coat U domain-containing protein [Pseudomonas aeruginosa]